MCMHTRISIPRVCSLPSLKDFQFSTVTVTQHKIQINKTQRLLILKGFDDGVQTPGIELMECVHPLMF
jgi:hypothetical protein